MLGYKPSFSWAGLLLGIRDLYQEIEPDSKLLAAYYYTALSERNDNPEKYDNHKKFIDAISKVPFIKVVVGHLMRRPKTPDVPVDKNDPNTYIHIEKGTDINISNDMLEKAHLKQYDVALLVSADGDYDDTINKIKALGIDFYVVLPVGTPAWRLKENAGTNLIYLDCKFLEPFVIKRK